MKIKEIATVSVAGIASLAALILVEVGDTTPPSSLQPSVSSDSIAFEDTSRLIETSLPAPTAEPPAIVDEPQPEELLEENPVPPEADLVSDSPIESLPELSAPPSSPIVEPPVVAEPVIESDATENSDALAGFAPLDDPAPVADSSFVDSFAEAVEKATADIAHEETGVVAPSAVQAATTSEDGEPLSIIEETPNGFWLREAKLNDVFQHLAQIANHQYFHNADLDGPSFLVTGQLMDDDPVRQMEELALMYGVTIHTKGNTVYALNSAQLSQLPTQPFRYQLKYLRPSDIEQIKLILQPFLTPGSGIIEYETKTNTLIVMDNERKLDALALFLDQIDQPKQQIAIETRILRVSSSTKNQIGVDWSSVLGDSGTSISAATSLNALFNLPDISTVSRVITSSGSGGGLQIASNNRDFSVNDSFTRENNDANLVLSPVQLSVVLRALNTGGLAQQESSPTLITEDNEEGLISIIDRVPIITATVSETAAGSNVTEEVRYTIDASDPVGDAATTREIGVSVAVTPTILPDDTIRMALRPRSAQIVDYVQGQTGNLYPRVNESTVTTTARVPNGYSLLIGGFYEETTADRSNKVPILGDIPAVNLLFKNTSKDKQNTSLVFIVTPKLYRPDATGTETLSHEIHESHVLPSNFEYPDPNNPGDSYKPNLKNTLNNVFKKNGRDPESHILNPAHPYNLPESDPGQNLGEYQEPNFETPSVTVRSANARNRNGGGLLGKLFGGNKATHN
ncbi:MAG: hypothetical protein P1U87_16620 [Verrucomicrobiales bacterium]|nr:hypothetical protein [Verrucomicrobiales bacterium]